jgi:hypothetical protein
LTYSPSIVHSPDVCLLPTRDTLLLRVDGDGELGVDGDGELGVDGDGELGVEGNDDQELDAWTAGDNDLEAPRATRLWARREQSG